MNSKPNDHRTGTADTEARERLTAVYAAFNHALASRDGDLAALIADATWTHSADADSTSWVDRVGAAVAEHARDVVPETTDHLQALPEQFTEEAETVIVTGAYVGTTTDGSRFDVPFTHSCDTARGVVLEQTGDADDTLGERVVDT